MKKIKVSYMGNRLKDIYPHATRIQVARYKFNKFMEKVVLASFLLGMIYGAFHLGQATTESKVTYAEVETVKEVEVTVYQKLEIMDRIAKCESPNGHYNKNGKVVFAKNTNGTWDIGKYQINSIHLPDATNLGLDVTKEKDNEAFAYHLLNTQGTEPWYSSKHCWKK